MQPCQILPLSPEFLSTLIAVDNRFAEVHGRFAFGRQLLVRPKHAETAAGTNEVCVDLDRGNQGGEIRGQGGTGKFIFNVFNGQSPSSCFLGRKKGPQLAAALLHLAWRRAAGGQFQSCPKS
jgi:hypothetical protein